MQEFKQKLQGNTMQMKKKVGQENALANIHKTMWLWINPIVAKLEAFLRQRGDAWATTTKKNDENAIKIYHWWWREMQM